MRARLRAFFRGTSTRVAGLLTPVGGVMTGLGAIDEYNYLLVPGIVLTGCAGLWTAVTGIRASRTKRRKSLEKLLKHHPPRRVSAGVEQADVGIERSAIADRYRRGDDWPDYVPRDIDQDLDDALRNARLVVVRGRSKEGKSRAAFQAVRRLPGNPYLAILQPGESVADLAAIEDPWPTDASVVLWLDRIDTFLRGGGLTPSVCERLTKDSRVIIVGTIENRLWDKIRRATDADHESYGASAVLRMGRAAIVHLPPATPAERQRALDIYGAGQEFKLGIGQHFVSASELHAAYDTAPSLECAAALRAVVDWQLTGIPRPIKHSDLKRLYVEYLNGADPSKWLDEGIAWANTGLGDAGYRLLLVEGGTGRSRKYRTPDHVVEYVHERAGEPVTDRAWELAVKAATTAEEALAVGLRAGDDGKWTFAAEALEVAGALYPKSSTECAQAEFRLGQAYRRLGDDDSALKAFDRATDAGHVQAWNLKGYLLLNHGKLDQAEDAFVHAIEKGNRTAAFNLLEALAGQQRLKAAEECFRKAVEAGNPAAALMLGNVKHADRKFHEALSLYRMAEGGDRKVDVPHRKRAKMLRALIEEESGHHAEARALFDEAWDERQWELTVERLEQVGIADRLEQVRQRLLT